MKQGFPLIEQFTLAQLDEQLRFLLQVNEEGLMIHKDGIILFANDACIGLFGYTHDELIGEELLNLASPESKPVLIRTMATGEEGDFQGKAIKKDGTIFPVQTRVKTIQLGESYVRLVGIKDMSEEVFTKERLRETEDRLSLVISATSIGTFDSIGPGKDVFWDQGMYDIFELPPTTDVDLHEYFFRVIHPDEKEEFIRIFDTSVEKSKKSERYFKFGFRIILPSGKTKFLESEGQFYLDNESQLTRVLGICHDITEQRSAQRAVKDSEKRLKSIVENSKIGISLVKQDGRSFLANESYLNMLGYSREEFFKMTFSDFTHPADLTLCYQGFNDILEKRADSFSIEKRYIRKDGEIVWTDTSAIGIWNQDGVFQYAVATTINISKRKKALQELNESEKRFKSIFEHSQIGIALVDTSGRTFLVNKAFASLLGYEEEEMTHLSFEDYIYEEDLKIGLQRFQEMIEGKLDTFLMEKRYIHKNGELIWTYMTGTAVRNSEGEIQFAVATVTDLRERKETETKLKESEKKFKSIFNNSEVGIALVAENGIPFFINPALQKILGYSEEDLCKMSFMEFTHPEDAKKNLEEYQRLIAGEIDTYSMEKRYIHKNGSIVWGYLTVSAVKTDTGKMQYAISLVADISELKKTQFELYTREKRFKDIFEYSNVSLTLANNEGKLFFVNDAFLNFLGYSRQELSEMTVRDLTHPDDVHVDVSNFKKILRNELNTTSIEKRYFHKNGEIRWGHLTVSAVKNESGGIQYTIGVIIDITQQKRTELALEKSEKMFRQVVQDQADLIVRWKPGGILQFVNDAYCKTYSKSRDELLGRSFFPMMSLENYNYLLEDLETLSIEKPSFTRISKDLLPDGKEMWLEWYNRAFFDKEGEFIEIQAIGRDITARKHAEEQLIKNEVKYRSLFEQATEAIYLTDMSDLSLIECNNQAVEMFGYTSKEEFLSKKLFHLSPAMQNEYQSSEELSIELHKVLSKDGYHQLEWNHIRKDGSIFAGEVGLTVIQLGEKVYLQAVLRDITERQEAERKLKSAYKEVEQLKKQLERENKYLINEIRLNNNFENIVFQSPQMTEVLKKVEQVAPVDATVLVLGETGTGKELIARAVHKHSRRKSKALVKVNCAALPRDLIESELFGHEKGAFTGAQKQKIGRFELAQNGTIFLDEIGEIPYPLQAKLLRVLQEGEFERIGGTETIKLDVRIIAATNRNLKEAIEKGEFREDLYYRLHVFPIEIPSLRERPSDIVPLANYFLSLYGKKFNKVAHPLSDTSKKLLKNYAWPGNVRELENLIERGLILARDGHLNFDQSLGAQVQEPEENLPELSSLNLVEKNHILKVLKKVNWRINGAGGAAEILGLTPTTVRDRMKKHGIQRPEA
ncbi:MAG: PAS domain S-box protein [Bacteroidia bacterium]|nr:PAS domain S-box protein [Bacteroidia bacterium]